MVDQKISILQAPFSIDTISKWTGFLHHHPHGNFFQSSDFLLSFHQCKNYKPIVLFSENPEGTLTGVLIALIINERIYGIPFQRILIQGGPVVAANLPERTDILRGLLKALRKQISRNIVFVEIRNLQLWSEENAIFKESGFEWHDHLNDILPINSKERYLAEIKPARQRQIRRGIENGAIIRAASSIAEVESFYRLLKDLYQKKIRKPLPPLTFFKNFYQKIQQEKKGVVLVVIYKEEVIGGMVCPFSGTHTLHEWYICSLQNRLKHLYPGVLATWAGIDFAFENNFSCFDFMGIGTPQKPYGVRNFKTRFGGEVINFGRWQLINNKFRYNLGLLGYKLLKFWSKS